MFLQYWPSVTAAPNASLATANSSEVVTQVVGNITMTSPSVYLVFDHLQAMSSTNLDPTCSLSSPLGATGTLKMAGGGAIRPVGGPYTNAVVSLDATGLSSLVRDLGPINTASVVSEIAHGGPSYSYWINAVRGTGRNYGTGYYSSVMAKSVEYANFMVPDAEAYYMNINGAPGCNRQGDHPQCSTIYDGAYRAQLLVPKEVRTLRPEWAECFDPLFGALDPPIALTQVASVKGPELPSEPAKGTPPNETPPNDQPKQTATAVPGHTVPSDSRPTSPPPKSSPTALPEANPDDEPSAQAPSEPDDEPADDDEIADDISSSNNDNPSNNEPSNGNPKNNDNTSDDDNSKDNGLGSSEAPTQGGNPDHRPQGDTSGPSPSDGRHGATGEEGSGKKPQNALDVLTAAQKSDEAKATASSGSGNSESSGNVASADNGNSNNEGTAGSSSNGDSDATHGQSFGGDSDDDESNGHQTSTNNESSGEDENAGTGSDVHEGSTEQVVNINGKAHTVAEQDGVPVIDGAPLPTDSSPMTIDGQSVSAVDGAIVIGTHTIDLAGDQTADSQTAVFTADGQAFTVVPSSSGEVAIVDGTTLSVGGPAVTAHGATISAASNGVVVDGSTIEYEDASSAGSPAVVTLGSNVATASAIGSDVFAIGTVTLTAGGSDAAISGHTVSAASSGIVVDGSSSSTDVKETQNPQATQTTSSDQGGQSLVAGSEALKLHAAYWAVLLGSGLLLLL